MPALIRIYSVEQLPSGKLHVTALLPDGSTVDGEIDASLDQQSIARAVTQLPAHRPLPHLTGQVTLEDDEYRELRALALAGAEQARDAQRVDPTAAVIPAEALTLDPSSASSAKPVTRSSRGK